ncbi:hypothetical protein J6590_028654 [Homalodisca vitripennis]|nr:hypothetical protein J6590_028654 [Homalodisca vitripennis]
MTSDTVQDTRPIRELFGLDQLVTLRFRIANCQRRFLSGCHKYRVRSQDGVKGDNAARSALTTLRAANTDHVLDPVHTAGQSLSSDVRSRYLSLAINHRPFSSRRLAHPAYFFFRQGEGITDSFYTTIRIRSRISPRRQKDRGYGMLPRKGQPSRISVMGKMIHRPSKAYPNPRNVKEEVDTFYCGLGYSTIDLIDLYPFTRKSSVRPPVPPPGQSCPHESCDLAESVTGQIMVWPLLCPATAAVGIRKLHTLQFLKVINM